MGSAANSLADSGPPPADSGPQAADEKTEGAVAPDVGAPGAQPPLPMSPPPGPATQWPALMPPRQPAGPLPWQLPSPASLPLAEPCVAGAPIHGLAGRAAAGWAPVQPAAATALLGQQRWQAVRSVLQAQAGEFQRQLAQMHRCFTDLNLAVCWPHSSSSSTAQVRLPRDMYRT